MSRTPGTSGGKPASVVGYEKPESSQDGGCHAVSFARQGSAAAYSSHATRPATSVPTNGASAKYVTHGASSVSLAT
jgi:hypothetical protein